MIPGTRLGPYEIVEQLGAGGMGEVYLAQDTRLGRKVAIKVLPEEYAGDPERLARFEQEARAAAALNHPNIAAVHDVGESDGTHYIVQEYLEGHSLRAVLRDNPPKLDRALQIGADVADALATAHKAGIIHRDIKPDNIFITESGHTKVLDFGLAKLVETGGLASAPDATMSPTAMGTMAGVVMGTVGYMAPEQIEGGEIDGRTDIFALGCMLYEMIGRRRPFEGNSVHTTLGKILEQDPEPIRELRPGLPHQLDWIIDKCLAKAPERRYQGASDLGVDLGMLKDTRPDPDAAPRRGPRTGTAWRIAVAGIAGVALGMYAASRYSSPASVPTPVLAASIELPDDLALARSAVHPLGSGHRLLAATPDGDALVYTAEVGGDLVLALRSLAPGGPGRGPLQEPVARIIPGTEGGFAPFLSPDGAWLGFSTATHLMKVPLRGGSVAVPIAEVRNVQGAVWGPDDWIYFSRQYFQIARVNSDGGPVELIAAHNDGLLNPDLLPDGTLIANTNPYLGGSVVHVALDGTVSTLADGFTWVSWLSPGFVLLGRGNAVFAAPFRMQEHAILGTPLPVADGVRSEFMGVSQLTSDAGGTVWYVPGGSAQRAAPVWATPEGETFLGFEAGHFDTFSLSPDADRLALVEVGANSHIYVHELTTGASLRLTLEGNNRWPIWSPDGEWIAFSSDRAGAFDVWRKRSDGTGAAERLSRDAEHQWASDWPQGCDCLIVGTNTAGFELSLDDLSIARPLSDQRFVEWGFVLSPDERWMAFVSDQSGRYEIWVADFGSLDRRRQLSFGGGEEPLWSGDGRRLYFKPSGREWAYLDFDPDAGVANGDPVLVAAGNYRPTWGFSYDLTADGRVLLMRPADQVNQTHVAGVLGAGAELARVGSSR